jgi:hypothetical protein
MSAFPDSNLACVNMVEVKTHLDELPNEIKFQSQDPKIYRLYTGYSRNEFQLDMLLRGDKYGVWPK